MKSLHPPKVKQDPTLPFTAIEVNAIASACDRFPLKGIYGEGNRKRLRAMVFLLHYSGLRIRDAATLRRERVQNGKLLLYMQKTGVPVFVPLPPRPALRNLAEHKFSQIKFAPTLLYRRDFSMPAARISLFVSIWANIRTEF